MGYSIELRVFLLFAAVVIVLIVAAIIRLIGRRTEISPKSEAGDPRLVRFAQKETVGGVCVGLAYKFGIPPWVVKVTYVVLALGLPEILIVYLICWIMMPKASEIPADYGTRTERF